MEFGQSVPKEPGSRDSGGEYRFLAIEPKVGEPYYERLLEAFKRYWQVINPDFVDSVIDVGEGLKLERREAILLQYWTAGFDAQVVRKDNEIVGFLIYQVVFDAVLLVKGLFVEPVHLGRGLAKGLIDSLNRPIRRVIFQTQKEFPPERLLGLVSGRTEKLGGDCDMETWEMTWEAKTKDQPL